MDILAANILLALLSIINLMLHSFGLTLLCSVYRGGRKTAQQLYLMNISLTEAMMSFLNALSVLLFIVYFCTHTPKVVDIAIYIGFIANSGGYLLYFSSMLFITCDRFFIVLFYTKYITKWNIRKTLRMIASAWIVNFFVALVTILVLLFVGDEKILAQNVDKVFSLYIPTTLNVMFLVFAVIAYSVMFRKYLVSHRTTRTYSFTHGTALRSDANVKGESLFQIFRKSRFFVSVLVIFSYLMFLVIPSLIYSSSQIFDIPQSTNVTFCLHIFTRLSDTMDAIIYIFMYQPVRSRCLEWLHLSNNSRSPSRGHNQNNQNNQHNQHNQYNQHNQHNLHMHSLRTLKQGYYCTDLTVDSVMTSQV